MKTQTTKNEHPSIVKVVLSARNDIHCHSLSRHAIGYMLRGRKYIYSGDVRHEVKQGDLFYLNIGSHYLEDIPDADHHCEQIVFFYTSEELSDTLSKLNTSYDMPLINNRTCENSDNLSHVIYTSWPTMKHFFGTVNQYIKEDVFACDRTAESLKKTELIYLLMSHDGCRISELIMTHIDVSLEKFKQVVRRNIFNRISIGELASECNRSLTSFKKEFRRIFHQPPHMWIVNQRLLQSRLLLVSTNKTISEIGNECSFPNTSHFIKLFKKEYGTTPADYRNSRVLNRQSDKPDDHQ